MKKIVFICQVYLQPQGLAFTGGISAWSNQDDLPMISSMASRQAGGTGQTAQQPQAMDEQWVCQIWGFQTCVSAR
jgi:hypothetical protein